MEDISKSESGGISRYSDFANRVKFGVAVPPDTKEPMTSPAPPITVKEPLDTANYYSLCCVVMQ